MNGGSPAPGPGRYTNKLVTRSAQVSEGSCDRCGRRVRRTADLMGVRTEGPALVLPRGATDCSRAVGDPSLWGVDSSREEVGRAGLPPCYTRDADGAGAGLKRGVSPPRPGGDEASAKKRKERRPSGGGGEWSGSANIGGAGSVASGDHEGTVVKRGSKIAAAERVGRRRRVEAKGFVCLRVARV